MRDMTADDLVQAVSDCESADTPVVTSKQIEAWSDRNGVRYNSDAGPNNDLFWKADSAEARGHHRLQKFTQGTARNSPNGWSLQSSRDRAMAWVRDNDWYVIPWDSTKQKWDWERSHRPKDENGIEYL